MPVADVSAGCCGAGFRCLGDGGVSAGCCVVGCAGTCGCAGFWRRLLGLGGYLRVPVWAGCRRPADTLVSVDHCEAWVPASGRCVRICGLLCCGLCGDLRLCRLLAQVVGVGRLSASFRVVRVPVSGRCVCICGFLFHRLYGDLRLYLHLVQVVEVERISAGFCACRVPVSGGCACICGFL